MTDLRWQCDGSLASIESCRGTIEVQVDGTVGGFYVRGPQIPIGPIFAFPTSSPPMEVVTRGQDLVMRFPPRAEDRLSYEVRYRVSQRGDGLDMVLSAQTELLKSHPETAVTAVCPEAELLQSPGDDLNGPQRAVACGCIVRPVAYDTSSLLLMVHPRENGRMEIQGSNVTFHVFCESLEKGVIRRVRFRLRWLSRMDDEREAREQISQAKNETLPLTS